MSRSNGGNERRVPADHLLADALRRHFAEEKAKAQNGEVAQPAQRDGGQIFPKASCANTPDGEKAWRQNREQ